MKVSSNRCNVPDALPSESVLPKHSRVPTGDTFARSLQDGVVFMCSIREEAITKLRLSYSRLGIFLSQLQWIWRPILRSAPARGHGERPQQAMRRERLHEGKPLESIQRESSRALTVEVRYLIKLGSTNIKCITRTPCTVIYKLLNVHQTICTVWGIERTLLVQKGDLSPSPARSFH